LEPNHFYLFRAIGSGLMSKQPSKRLGKHSKGQKTPPPHTTETADADSSKQISTQKKGFLGVDGVNKSAGTSAAPLGVIGKTLTSKADQTNGAPMINTTTKAGLTSTRVNMPSGHATLDSETVIKLFDLTSRIASTGSRAVPGAIQAVAPSLHILADLLGLLKVRRHRL